VASLSVARVTTYLDGLVPERPAELRRMEAAARRTGFPIIGPACGHVCYLVARLTGARRIFELGSGYGYSTAWFARAVVENPGGPRRGRGEVHHVVWDEALSRRARAHLDALGYGGIVRYHVSEAVAALESAPGRFDLIFNDIDKEGYPGSLPAIRRKLRPGGVLIVDNLLWDGRIFSRSDRTAATRGVRELTRLVMGDRRWTATIVPIRDGLLVARWEPGLGASNRAARGGG
jgi:predicted O-methyltransferase YrrM